MIESRPVSDEDVRAAWDAFFARSNAELNERMPPLPPDHPSIRDAQITLDALRRVLENDRRRATAAQGA